MNQADLSKLLFKLRYNVKPRRTLKNPLGSEGRLLRLRKTVTALFKYERLEMNYNHADEARGYAERLIGDAIRYGDCHKQTMEMADYWLEEKQLIHKLFKVLVPRYKDSALSYTSLFKAPKRYPDNVFPRSVLELRGNPFPPLVFDSRRNKNLIHNILLDEARKDYRLEKYNEIVRQVDLSENAQNTITDETEVNAKSEAAKQVAEDEQLLKAVSELTFDDDATNRANVSNDNAALGEPVISAEADNNAQKKVTDGGASASPSFL